MAYRYVLQRQRAEIERLRDILRRNNLVAGAFNADLSLPMYYDHYFCLWYKDNYVKCKVTKRPPHKCIDNFGWVCKRIYLQGSFFPLDHWYIDFKKIR